MFKRGFLQRDASMRAIWSAKQNRSHSVSQNIERIRRFSEPCTKTTEIMNLTRTTKKTQTATNKELSAGSAEKITATMEVTRTTGIRGANHWFPKQRALIYPMKMYQNRRKVKPLAKTVGGNMLNRPELWTL